MEQRIGFGPRLGALLIDAVICGVLVGVFGGVIGGMLGAMAGGAGAALSSGSGHDAASTAAMGGMIGAVAGIVIATVVISLVYFLIEGFTGLTLGKLILGMQVANADGTRAPTSKLLARWACKNNNAILTILAGLTGLGFLKVLGTLGGLAFLVGCFFAISASKQALHDRICDTAVWPRKLIRAA
ncbi:MAG TPA: RDD family protein [Gemmatimonadales bacterium]